MTKTTRNEVAYTWMSIVKHSTETRIAELKF